MEGLSSTSVAIISLTTVGDTRYIHLGCCSYLPEIKMVEIP